MTYCGRPAVGTARLNPIAMPKNGAAPRQGPGYFAIEGSGRGCGQEPPSAIGRHRRTVRGDGIAIAESQRGHTKRRHHAEERRRIVSHPPDILVTTPESLFLLLTSKARRILSAVDTVIVDEVHAIAGSKRGAHLALSLERLESLAGRSVQRIGLSAMVNRRPKPHVSLAAYGRYASSDPNRTPTWI